MKQVTIHTDGGCEGNPGVGGWAAVLRHEARSREVSGGDPATTNNRMELRAAIEALRALKEPCQVDLFTDSQYLRQGITEWIPLWKARKWKTTQKKPVKNEDLWRELDLFSSRHTVQWHWVRGHAGHKDNERCDVLANQEIHKIRKQFTAPQLAQLREAFVNTRPAGKGQGNLL